MLVVAKFKYKIFPYYVKKGELKVLERRIRNSI